MGRPTLDSDFLSVYNGGLGALLLAGGIILGHFRGVAQLVARTAGGREVAGSSPVTPTNKKDSGEAWVFFIVG